jgi:ABC-type glycerol-3-phosphate transport system substrate-binding protein
MSKIIRVGKMSLIIAICLSLVNVGASCTKGGDPAAVAAYQPIKLVYWGVWNNSSDLSDLIAEYKKIQPNVSIEYHKIPYADYEKELVDALAEDRGPDVFSIHNTWVTAYQNKILSMPASTKMARKFITGTVKKEEVTQFVTTKGLAPADVIKQFVEVVGKDVIVDNKVLGLQLNLDSMFLYYNKDILDNKGIPLPPASWQDFEEQVHKIKEVDEDGNLKLAAAAIGAGANVARSADLLSLLMMQNLTKMVDDTGKVSFDLVPAALKGKVKVAPGQSALEFYTKFADPLYDYYYTWNQKMPNSLDSFINGQTAFFFGYGYNLATIYSKAPKLNFAIAPMPQIAGNPKVNFANYWVETVSKKTKNADAAWNFLQFITGKDIVKTYLTKSQRPTALRSLINDQLNDPVMGVFADQVLTAKSWYHGMQPNQAEQIFIDMIDNTVAGKTTAADAVNLAVKKIAQTWNK